MLFPYNQIERRMKNKKTNDRWTFPLKIPNPREDTKDKGRELTGNRTKISEFNRRDLRIHLNIILE